MLAYCVTFGLERQSRITNYLITRGLDKITHICHQRLLTNCVAAISKYLRPKIPFKEVYYNFEIKALDLLGKVLRAKLVRFAAS